MRFSNGGTVLGIPSSKEEILFSKDFTAKKEAAAKSKATRIVKPLWSVDLFSAWKRRNKSMFSKYAHDNMGTLEIRLLQLT